MSWWQKVKSTTKEKWRKHMSDVLGPDDEPTEEHDTASEAAEGLREEHGQVSEDQETAGPADGDDAGTE
jgi:hypothetical protein